MPLDNAAACIDPQRVLNLPRLDKFGGDGVGDGVIPPEMQTVVVIAVVGVSLPVAGEADGVWRFFEAPIEEQLGANTAFNASEHQLRELPVKQWTYLGFDA
jgi:hypothetical protein